MIDKQLPPIDPNGRYEIPEIAWYSKQSRAQTFKDIAAGKIETYKVGKRRYAHGQALIEYLKPPAVAA